MRPVSENLLPRIPIIEVFPVVEDGTLPAKATEGEPFPIRATVFREGHDAFAAEAVLLTPDGGEHSRTRMVDVAPGLDRYEAWVAADAPGAWSFRVDSWSDPYATWHHDATIKLGAGVDVELMLEEGARLMERAAAGDAEANPTQERPPASDIDVLHDAARRLRDTTHSAQQRLSAGISSRVRLIFRDHPLRDLIGSSRTYRLDVARTKALAGAWYEIFPRSAGAFQRPDGSWVSGTLASAAEELPRIAEMGFDVVYLTPIHPIGSTHRKGKNNSLIAAPGDPGSPYGIGSPDHPWVSEHPEWFTTRADGSIAYAENPPKKYQDIYPLNFDNDPAGIYEAIRAVIEVWIRHGVTIFRVDNPHTKPIPFWEKMLADVKAAHPGTLFLAEAFTRPAMMRTLGAIGFDQSYTYFAWRTAKTEIEDYLLEVSQDTAHLMRPAFWPTTHDILTPQMWEGGTAIFAIRAMLAALGSPTWGIYSGYEFVENVPRGSFQEPNDNEKYEFRPRRWADADDIGITRLFTLLNAARAKHPALRQLHQIRIHPTSSDSLVAFSRQVPGRFTHDGVPDTVICVISLDPHNGVDASVELDLEAMGLATPGGHITVVDELDGRSYVWGSSNWVSLSPVTRLGHVFTVEPAHSSPWAQA